MGFNAQFVVDSVELFRGDAAMVKMSADTSTHSDYAKYTPSGSLSFYCTNPEVLKQIAPGKKFALQFTELDGNAGQ